MKHQDTLRRKSLRPIGKLSDLRRLSLRLEYGTAERNGVTFVISTNAVSGEPIIHLEGSSESWTLPWEKIFELAFDDGFGRTTLAASGLMETHL